MQPVFTRTNCSSTEEILRELWDRRLIALHYGDSSSLDANDYPVASKHALRRLQRYASEGAIVAADFRRLHRDRLLVGELRPDSEVWSEKFGDRYVYKVTQLTNCREVLYADFPVLLAVQPRQGTLVGWPSARNVLRSALDGEPLPIEAGSLSPDQFEVVCYEYLRMSGKISRLLMPIGRGLIEIDILGIDHLHRPVFAQVTQARSKQTNAVKMKNLLAHLNVDTQLFFFGFEKHVPETPGVSIIDVEDVFNDTLDDTGSRAMVFRMLGFKAESPESHKIELPIAILNEDLSLRDLPEDTAPISSIERFALTFHGYEYWEAKRKSCYDEAASECNCLSHLRTKLFLRQRAGRQSNGMSRNEAIPILKSIRAALEKATTWC
jgi:hypothetical protein